MKMEKVQLIFNKELSKINYDVIGSLTDLKLHLVVMEENCDDELFNMFCQQEYDLFTEELEVEMKHVGRTSKFRIDYECDDFEDETDEEYVEKIITEYVEDLKTIVDVYETIDDFKQHQVEYWNEFIEEA